MDEARRLQLRRFAQMYPEERLRVGVDLSTLGMRWKREQDAPLNANAATLVTANAPRS